MHKWFLLVLVTFVPLLPAAGQVSTSLYFNPKLFVPVNTYTDDGTQRFAPGGGLSIGAELGMPFARWLYFEGVLDSGIIPVKNASISVQNLSLGIGAGARFLPASRLVMKGSVYGGGEVLLFDGETALVPFVQPGIDIEFQFSPAFNMGLGGGYRMAFGGGGLVYQGVSVTLNLAYNLGTSKSGARIEASPNLTPIYPLYYTYYNENPLGSLTLKNNERDTLKNVSVSYYVPQYMDRPRPSGTVIEKIGADGEVTFPLYALFSNDIFEVTEGLIVAGEIHVDYTWLGKEFTKVEPVSVDIYNRNAMTWDDDRKAAAFVTANNPLVKSYSKNIAADIRSDDRDIFDLNFRIGMGLFEALTLHGTGYVVDPASAYINKSSNEASVDFVQFPSETLAYQAGDCDDLSVLYNAMLEASGIETAFITAPGHIFTAYSLGVTMERAGKIFSDTSNLIDFEEKAWVPVEVTLVEKGFLEAWRVGAREWRETSQAGTSAFYPTHTAWTTYKPVENPTGELVFLPDPDDVFKAYGNALDRMIFQEVTPLVRELQERINREGASPAAHNRIGIVYAKYGLLDEAEPWFRKSTAGRPFAAGEVNLGNVFYLRGDFTQAVSYYKKALVSDGDNPRALLGMAKASFELEDYSAADQTMVRLAAANPEMAREYSYLGSATDAPVLRASSAVTKDVYGWDD